MTRIDAECGLICELRCHNVIRYFGRESQYRCQIENWRQCQLHERHRNGGVRLTKATVPESSNVLKMFYLLTKGIFANALYARDNCSCGLSKYTDGSLNH